MSESNNIKIHTPEDFDGMRKAGLLAAQTLDMIIPHVVPGVTTDALDKLCHDFIVAHGAQPAPLNYRGFPKSVCVSINEVVCHGIPGNRILEDGDIVNVDVTSILNGYYADANKTFFAGMPGPDARKIVAVAKECLKRGIAEVKPGNT
ncbi:MAG: M24 family metallopeptidase, partial [Sphingomonadales bacterium]|nr:M24 family metallopeptidase [Sphingomonadales bacterium]